MSQGENYGIPPGLGIEDQDMRATIAGAKPSKSHGALRRALARRWPSLAWRVVAPADKFTTDGLCNQDMVRVDNNAGTWLRQRVDEAGGDHLAVWRRYKGDTTLLRTEVAGTTVWACAAIGPNVADYLQLQVDEIQEVTVGPLVDGADWRQPHNVDELCVEPRTPTGDRCPAL